MKRSKSTKMSAIFLGCILFAFGIAANAINLGDAVREGKTGGDLAKSCFSPGDLSKVERRNPFSVDFKFIRDKAELKNVLGILASDDNPRSYRMFKVILDRFNIDNSPQELSLFFYSQSGVNIALNGRSDLYLRAPSRCGDRYVSSVDGVVMVLEELKIGPFNSIDEKQALINKVANATSRDDVIDIIMNTAFLNNQKITPYYFSYGDDPRKFDAKIIEEFGSAKIVLDCSIESRNSYCNYDSGKFLQTLHTFVKNYISGYNVETMDYTMLFQNNPKLSPYSMQ